MNVEAIPSSARTQQCWVQNCGLPAWLGFGCNTTRSSTNLATYKEGTPATKLPFQKKS